MDLLTLALVVIGMCCMFMSFVIGVLAVLNQPTSPGTTLLSAEDLEALANEANNADKGPVQYSNVAGAWIGDPSNILSTQSVDPAKCESLCHGNQACQGFQLHSTGGCDLLANASTTFAFTNPNYNLVMPSIRIPLNILGQPISGEIDTRQDLAMTPSPSAPQTVYECARACKSQESQCKSFSWSPSAGCKLKKARDQSEGAVAPVDQYNFNSYFLKGVNHDTWIVPGPAPSPS